MKQAKKAEVYVIKGDWLGKVEKFQVFEHRKMKLVWFGPSQQPEDLILEFDSDEFIKELEAFLDRDEPEVMVINVDDQSAETFPAKEFAEVFRESRPYIV